MDLNTNAFHIVTQATQEQPPRKRAFSKGGSKGGAARAKALTPERRLEIAKAASLARWKRPA